MPYQPPATPPDILTFGYAALMADAQSLVMPHTSSYVNGPGCTSSCCTSHHSGSLSNCTTAPASNASAPTSWRRWVMKSTASWGVEGT